MRIFRLVIFATLLAVVASPAIEAGTLRIALLASTEVQSDTILLAHLLPANASRAIRDAAEKVALGTAPQNGISRQFTRESLNTTIASSGLSPADFAIPAIVTVRRGSRLISLEEIYAAIQSALARNPLPGLTSLQLQDLALDADVRVPPGNAGLVVTQATLDQFLGRARFTLLPTSAPGVHAFFVTAKLAASVPDWPHALSRQLMTVASHSVAAIDTSGQFLVAADRPARLHIHSSNMDMFLEVRPLQKGRLGDVMRVRLLGTGRTIQARVGPDGLLDATL